MNSIKVPIRIDNDVYIALSLTRHLIKPLIFSKVDEQKILVSVSELTRNILEHSGTNGEFSCEVFESGIRITAIDKGVGIEKVDDILNGSAKLMTKGLGLGLAGVKRLMDDFWINTSKGGGTKIIAIKWRD